MADLSAFSDHHHHTIILTVKCKCKFECRLSCMPVSLFLPVFIDLEYKHLTVFVQKQIFYAMQELKIAQFRENHAAKTIQRTWRDHENEKRMTVCSCGQVQCLWLLCMICFQGTQTNLALCVAGLILLTPLVLFHVFH